MIKSDIEIRIGTTRFLFSVLFISICALLCSYIAEHWFYKSACYLCKLQRLPYIGIFFISIWGIFSINRQGPLYFLIGISMMGLSLGLYHFGILQHFFKDYCYVTQISNINDFQNLLASQACAKVQWKILGIPATLINIFVSFSLIVGSYIRLKTEKYSLQSSN